MKNFAEKMKQELNTEHEGAVAFEYIIILIIMVVALFTGFKVLADMFKTKSTQVADFIGGNGQTALSTGASK